MKWKDSKSYEEAKQKIDIEQEIENVQDLSHILDYHDYTAYFKAFLASEFSSENLEFWIEVNRFKHIDPVQVAQIHDIGLNIYNKFIKTGTEKEVNIPASMNRVIKKKVEEEDNITQDLYDDAHAEIFKLMKTVCVQYLLLALSFFLSISFSLPL